MSPHTTHPLVDAWLRDLELLLHGVDPGERAEVLAGVHEHLDGSLAPDSGDDEVRRVLADLGSPQSVADEAYAGRPAAAHPAAGTAHHPGEDLGRPSPRWVVITAGALLGTGIALLALTAALGGMGLELIVFFFLNGPLWLTASIMVMTTRRLWTVAEKVLLVCLNPLAYLVAALSSIALLNNGLPTYLIPWVGSVVAVAGGAALLVRSIRRGLARAR